MSKDDPVVKAVAGLLAGQHELAQSQKRTSKTVIEMQEGMSSMQDAMNAMQNAMNSMQQATNAMQGGVNRMSGTVQELKDSLDEEIERSERQAGRFEELLEVVKEIAESNAITEMWKRQVEKRLKNLEDAS